jgi:hypothetical protein
MAKIDALVIDCEDILQPGVQNNFLIIPSSDLSAFPQTANQATPNALTNEGDVTLAAAFAYTNNAAYWRLSPIFQQSGQVKSSKVGDVTNTGFKNEFMGQWADDSASVRGFVQRLDNLGKCGGFIAAIPMPEGGYIIVGDLVSPAKLEAATPQTGDKAGGDGRETKFTISNEGKIYYLYPASLTAPRIAPVV